MTKDEIIKALRDMAKYPTVTLPRDCEALRMAADLLAQPEQEPVTWRYKIVDVFGRPAWTLKTPKSDTRVLESQPLYTTPPQRKPLTDEEIILIVAECASSHQHTDIHFAKAIEAAHGIIAPTELKGEA